MRRFGRNWRLNLSYPTMTLSEQCAVWHLALERCHHEPSGVLQWAFAVIDAMEKPPLWIIELATLPSPRASDLLPVLREHSSSLTVCLRLQTVISAHCFGILSLRDTLPQLFSIAIFHADGAPAASDERLVDALIDWDQQDDLDSFDPHLVSRFQSIFRDYLSDASDVTELLFPRLQTVA